MITQGRGGGGVKDALTYLDPLRQGPKREKRRW